MVGGLVCKCLETGLQINVGPGKMKHNQREYYWLHQDKKLLVRLSNTRVWIKGERPSSFSTIYYILDQKGICNDRT